MLAFPPYAPVVLDTSSCTEDPSVIIPVLVITAIFVVGVAISALFEDINKNKKNRRK